jgi:hypothetical protein
MTIPNIICDDLTVKLLEIAIKLLDQRSYSHMFYS